MAFPVKPGPAASLTLVGQVPNPPKVPAEMIRRFPEWEAYDRDLQNWWSVVSGLIQDDRAQIKVQFQQVESRLKALESK